MFNCAETDDMFNDKMREKVKADLQANPKSPPHDFKVFEKWVFGPSFLSKKKEGLVSEWIVLPFFFSV